MQFNNGIPTQDEPTRRRALPGAPKKRPRTLRSEAIFLEASPALFSRLCVPRRYRVVRVAHSAADIHETAATAVVRGTSTSRMVRKAGSRRNQTSNDDVFLQSPQI